MREEYECGRQCAAVAMTNKIAIAGTNETEAEEGKNMTVACVTCNKRDRGSDDERDHSGSGGERDSG